MEVSMLKALILFFILILAHPLFAKTIEFSVLAKKSDVTADLKEEDLLTLNGFRQAITSELEELKLDSKLYWEKFEQKKLSNTEELQFFKPLFENVVIAQAAPAPKAEISAEVSGPTPKETSKEDQKLEGSFKAEINLEKLKSNFLEVTLNLAETKIKTFYILANIDLDAGTSWEDVGVDKAQNFSGVIIDSWKKLAQKEFKNFERVEALEKDFASKPDYMNSKSVTLKWNSTLKKVSTSAEGKKGNFELVAQYVLINTKSGDILTSFDFPIQKRELDLQNRKALSSTLASLVYNLLLSQTSKISGVLETIEKNKARSFVEIKIATKTSLSEIYAINGLLQEKFKDIKLASQMKTYTTDSASLLISADEDEAKILDRLSLEGGKFPLNEQKVLLFNRSDKSFAIIPKDSNNKN